MSLDEYPIDDDYIGVEKRPAAIGQSDEFRYDASHTYDRSDEGASGTARDVEIDQRSVSDHDRRGGTRTGFDPSDVEEGFLTRSVMRDGKLRTYSEWLRLLQHGYRDISLSRAQENADADTQTYIQTFTSVLEMSPYQGDRVTKLVESINMGHMAHYPREIIVLAVISVVANEDDRWIRDEQKFKDLVRDLDGSMEDVKNARRLVKEKSDLL